MLRKPLLLGPSEWVSDEESNESLLEAIPEEKGLDPDKIADWAYLTQVPNEKMQTGKDILRQHSRCLDTIRLICKVTLRLRVR